VAQIRDAVTKQHLRFQVGATVATRRDLSKIKGGVVPRPDVAALSAAKARRAAAPDKGNLVSAQMKTRALPPPRLLAVHQARRNTGDVGSGGGTGPTSQGTNQSGSGNQPYPSSANPSASASAFSWRDRMTAVKDQGQCGSCWDFASTAVMETNEVLYNGAAQSLDLAEQQILNCAPNPFHSDNCQGNAPESVWKYLSASPDALESANTYHGVMKSCSGGLGVAPYTLQDWAYVGEDIANPTVAEIKAAIVSHGPVAAGVNATAAFSAYAGGVFDEQDPGEMDHLITLTGWDDSKGAWYLRNSWSADWGEDGYMWIAYGSNKVGAWASWSQPVSSQPPTPTFADRYFSVADDAGEALNVYVEADVSFGNSWQWVPANPAPNAAAFRYSVSPGQTLDVKRSDSGQFLTAKAVRVWATSLDGKRIWKQYQGADFTLAPTPYQASQRERSTLHFQPAANPVPTADQSYAQATTARKASRWAAADTAYTQFVDHYPHDPRIHEGRFWLGWTEYVEKKFAPSMQTLANMINSAPAGQAFIPFAFYYLGLSEAAEGDCGYAERSLEEVAYGEVDAPPNWVQAAQSEIETLNNDDGTICNNWD
jgi:hypothetical protein